MKRRLDAGPLIALLGAILLLVSLFLDWWDIGASAWDVFELTDLLLAGLAIAGILAAASMVADVPGRIEGAWLPWLAAAALVLVVATLLDPPFGPDDEPGVDTGLWLAFAGAALMSAGALLSVASVSVTVDVAGRERRRRVEAVDERPHSVPEDDVTLPLPPTEPDKAA
jgi:peptidoglycan/LPS O-acetylase OafA/YrhL